MLAQTLLQDYYFRCFGFSVARVVGRLIRKAVGRLPCVVSTYQTTERRRSIYGHCESALTGRPWP